METITTESNKDPTVVVNHLSFIFREVYPGLSLFHNLLIPDLFTNTYSEEG